MIVWVENKAKEQTLTILLRNALSNLVGFVEFRNVFPVLLVEVYFQQADDDEHFETCSTVFYMCFKGFVTSCWRSCGINKTTIHNLF